VTAGALAALRARIGAIWARMADPARADSPRARLVQRLVQATAIIGVGAYLVYRLSGLGWAQVLATLPATPWFYVFFALRYLALPAAELLVYQTIWRRPLWGCFPVFLRKRVYNFGVMGYSGEAYLCLWGARQKGLDDKEVLLAVKDSNILSALVSNLLTAAMILAFAASGQLAAITKAAPGAAAYLWLAIIVSAVLVGAALRFHRRLLSIPPPVSLRVFGLHLARMLIVLALLAGQYAVAIPEAPWRVWLMFLAAQLVLDRAPLLPNKDLLFMGLGLALAGFAEAPEVKIAGVLVASAALLQVTNLALFVATSFGGHGLKPAART